MSILDRLLGTGTDGDDDDCCGMEIEDVESDED